MANGVSKAPSRTPAGKGATFSHRERVAAERPGEGLRARRFLRVSPHPTSLREATFSLWEKESRAGFALSQIGGRLDPCDPRSAGR
jgi:hypothetical protein